MNEEKPDKRPSCSWPITEQKEGASTTRQCGSEERVYTVEGKGLYSGRARKSDICEKHLPEAVKKWNWDSAVPVDLPSRK